MRLFLSVLLLLLPASLFADLKICNDTSQPVQFALERADNCDAETMGCDQYHVSGWITAPPKQCAVAFQGDTSPYEFAIFARAADGNTWTGGVSDQEFCIEPKGTFDHSGILSEVITCPESKRRAFKSVLQRGESSDFVFHLTTPGNPPIQK
jgi:hypothetical protein